jgi:hypothetical protein
MKNLAEAYNEFQKNYGQSVALDYGAIIEKLFSREFKKIANGAELVSKRENLEAQLAGVKDFAGEWTIEAKMIIPSACNKKCTIRYELSSEKAGRFDIMAVIGSEDGRKIDLVDEVFYQMRD